MPNNAIATIRQTARVDKRSRGDVLVVEYKSKDVRKEWSLPEKTALTEIRRIGDQAIEFALGNGASQGQLNAVLKALSDSGYYRAR